jgi:hypothetical protein
MTPYDHAPPVSPLREEPGSPAPPPLKQSGSEKRQRNRKTDTRWDDAEYFILTERAKETGLSRNAYIRAVVTGTPGPRAQRAPHVNAVELADATAAQNKAGNLLNQIAHPLNAGRSVFARDYNLAIDKTLAALDRILEIVGRKDRQ